MFVDYFDIDLNNVCAAETKLLKAVMVSDILDHPIDSVRTDVYRYTSFNVIPAA